jgi:hypothetical protein
MGIINWVERKAQKLGGRSPYYIVWMDRIDRAPLDPFDPSRDPYATLSSDQPMASRHDCILRPPQVACDRNSYSYMVKLHITYIRAWKFYLQALRTHTLIFMICNLVFELVAFNL